MLTNVHPVLLLQECPAVIYRVQMSNLFRVLFVSENVTKLTGYTPRTFIDNPLFWPSQLHPDDAPRVLAEFDRCFQPGEGQKDLLTEYRFRFKDGTYHWILDSARFTVNARGVPTEIVGSWLEITRRKEIEIALVAKERLLAESQAIAHIGSWTYDYELDGRLIWTDELYRLYGVSPAVFKPSPRSFLQLIHPDDRHAMQGWIGACLAGKQPGPLEFRAVQPDGTIREISGRGQRVYDKNRKIHYMTGTAQDITEHKATIERARRFSEEIVLARENERTQVALALHHDVGALAIGFSALIDSLEETLQAGNLRKGLTLTRGLREKCHQSLSHLKTMAADIRPPELDVLGLGPALRQYFSQIQKDGKLRIRFTESVGRHTLSGPAATILFRIVQESLTNAVRHGKARRLYVTLKDIKQNVELRVRDDGDGFDMTRLKRLAPSHMGLRVMQKMVATAKGAFSIDASPGRGAAVHVVLPCTATTP